MRKNPNTFLVGAPKSGTTVMADYLPGHPQVCFSSPKEVNYFNQGEFFQLTPRELGLDKYLDYFKQCSYEHNVVAEGSVWYLYSDTAIERIARFQPSAKLVVMLRRPDEMVYAQHSTHLWTCYELEENFGQAWAICEERVVGAKNPQERSKYTLLNYREIAKYGEQVNRLLSHFPRTQVHFVIYDDFKADNRVEIEKILRFLDLDLDYNPSFRTINANSKIKNRLIGRFVSKPPAKLVNLVLGTKKRLGINSRLGILRQLDSLNRAESPRAPLSEALRKEIVLHYRDDMELLQTTLQRDLSEWLY